MMSEVPSGGTKRHLQDSSDQKQAKKSREDSDKTADAPEVSDEETFYDSSWLYMDCGYCNMHMKELLGSRFHGEKLVLQMHAQYSVFSKSSRGDSASKEDVKMFKDEFLQKVCSLRNERGGVLIIHVTGKSAEKGPSLDDFDQKVGEELSRMVEDDTLYVENYDRRWYTQPQVFRSCQEQKNSQTEYLDYIVVNVKGSSSVSTKDFNTLVTWDGSKERPKAREISRLLWRTSLQPCFQMDKSANGNFKEGHRIELYESRDVQLKRLYDKDLEKDLQDHPSLVGKSLASRIAFRLKEKLHLLEYITSFTKLRTGGSFYCGIEEEKQKTVVVVEKSKSSKKSKKKKKKGHSSKTEGEEEKEDEVNPGENSSQTSDAQILEKESFGGVSKSSDLLRADLKLEVVESKIISNAVHERELCTMSSLSTKQTNELNGKSLQSVQTQSSFVDTNNVSEVTPTSQSSVQRSTSSNEQFICCEYEKENTAAVSGNNITIAQNIAPDVPSKLANCEPNLEAPVHSESKDYKTAHNIVKGFKLTQQEREELRAEILKMVQNDMLWLRTNGIKLNVNDISEEVEVLFHCTSEVNESYVIEVWVKKVFGGIVFYKRYGPDAFRLTGLSEKTPRVVRMDPSEWIRLLRKAMQCDNCDKPIWKLHQGTDQGQY